MYSCVVCRPALVGPICYNTFSLFQVRYLAHQVPPKGKTGRSVMAVLTALAPASVWCFYSRDAKKGKRTAEPFKAIIHGKFIFHSEIIYEHVYLMSSCVNLNIIAEVLLRRLGEHQSTEEVNYQISEQLKRMSLKLSRAAVKAESRINGVASRANWFSD